MLEIPGITDQERLDAFEWVTKAYPRFLPGHLNRAITLLSLDRLDEAETAYRHVLKRYPKELGALAGLALVLAKRGRHGDAEALAQEAIDAGYKWSPCFGVIADARAALGDTSGAARAHLAAYELSPHAWNHLEEHCRLTGRPYAPPTGHVPDFISLAQLETLVEFINVSDQGCDHTFRLAKLWHSITALTLSSSTSS